ncbi:DUF87 domain-containing protein [Mycoplasma flocculare]|uniref:Transfer complex protein TrsE n=1 Tax=Mesomycoplasma flocculare ATCC 27399 TaxID=743971 RepID=A0A0A8E6K3_MESFC|nr:DUF87 domain-containing protein [Mesomycoplasma flocculare]AJC49875.1 transfer complex protein TrsE [Mesomycoplasma flocculare ATCC 27399]ENX51212.1 TRSE-like protein [Mesomycoplasma flocculare ATCC 27716]MXR13614.1 DUF87 domain-containing protein [Mesomycoplasma flocculare]
MKLQNKRIKNVQIQIFRKITLIDLPIIMFTFFLSASISFGLPENIFVLWKILISASFFLIFTIPLIKHYKNWGLKGYKILWYKILYISRPKIYTKISKTSANTANLLPYTRAKQDFIKVAGGFVGGIEIRGQDIFSIGAEKIEQILQQLTASFNVINNRISIVKIAHPNDLTKNKLFFLTYQDECIKNLGEELCSEYKTDIANFDTYLHHRYFIIVYEKNDVSLLQQVNLLRANISLTGFHTWLAPLRDLLDLNLKIINFSDFLNEKEFINIKNGDDISKYLAQNKIEWHPEYFKINDVYFSVQTINEYPFNLPLGWAAQLFSTNSSVVWHLNRLTTTEKESSFNKGAKNLEYNLNDQRNLVHKTKTATERAALEEIINIAASSREEIFYSTFIFLNTAATKIELKEIESQNRNNLRNIGGTINPLKYRQLQGFASLFFRFSNFLKEEIEMPASNIAFGIPFTSRNFNDGNYNIIGISKTDYTPVFFDLFLQDQDRKNSNCFILGTSGAGKSTMTKKLLTYNKAIGNSVIVLDPQNEYWKIGDNLGANSINFGGGILTIFNPLQIQKVFNPQSKQKQSENFNNVETIALHLQNLEKFFGILLPNLDHKMLMAIIEAINEMYKNRDFYTLFDDVCLLEPDKFPTIKDLISQFDNMNFNYITDFEKTIVLSTLSYEFNEYGKLNRLFNGHSTNLDIAHGLVIFNVSTLMHLEKRIYQSAFFLVLSFIEGKIATNFYKNQKIVLIVDEAHRFIDESNTIALDFLFKIAKTIRKYNGSLIIATQNPSDFAISGEAARKSEAIIENCQYAFFFNLKSNDIEKVDKLFSSSGGLTKEEKKFIALAQIGEFIFSVNLNDRYICSGYFNKNEKKLFFDKGDKSKMEEN